MFVFVWARPLIAFSSRDFDLHYIAVLSGIAVTYKEITIYFSCLVVSMAAFVATVLALQLPRKPEEIKRENTKPFTAVYLQSWRTIFWIGVFASLVQTILYVRYFLHGGSYYKLYVSGEDAVGVPGLTFVASLMFYAYLGLLLTARDAQKIGHKVRRRLWTAVFVIMTVLSLTHGTRGGAFTELLVGVWLYAFTGGTRIKMRISLISGAGLFLLSNLVSALRSGSFSLFNSGTIVKVLEWFVYTQGLSGELVAPASTMFGVKLINLRFIFTPLLAPLKWLIDPNFGKQTVQAGQSSGLFALEFAYRSSPSYFLAGHGAGSSYIAETYCALGLFGVFIATAFLTWIVCRGPYLAARSQTALFVFSASLPFLLFTPRESLMFAVTPAIKSILIIFICLKLRKVICLLR
jgi:oligosaccharide repeat unit polymerase